ncbi:MAG: DMT family transporter [Pseudomonadota bacterium]
MTRFFVAALGLDAPGTYRTALLTTLAMLAFAANSLLCRLALRDDAIDPASFASARVIAGALTLVLIALPRWRRHVAPKPNWWATAMLFAYMVCFSFSYLTLNAGTGALILFGAVQITMFVVALRAGETFAPMAWTGFLLAVSGMIYLVLPGLAAPDPMGAALMAIAGLAWGLYTWFGRRVLDPLEGTAMNFIYAVPPVIVGSVMFVDVFNVSPVGLVLAALSGAVTSGLGYAIWYTAVKGLNGTTAATVQLSVPVIAAFGGLALLAEPLTLRLMVASLATLGGIAIVLLQKPKKAEQEVFLEAGINI